MSSFGENYKKNDLLDDIQHYFSEGGTIEEMFDVLRYIFEYGKTPLDDLIQENQKYKEVINKAIKYIEENKQHEYRNGNLDEYYLELNEKEMTELLDILKEVEHDS